MSTAVVVRIVFWLWLAAAVFVGYHGVLRRAAPSAVPMTVLTLTIALVFAYRRITAFRTWVDSIDLRALVLLHVTRFVGIYFLLLGQRGVLPQRIAFPAGVGDIAVAILALVVVLLPLAEHTRQRAIYFWNIFGFVDILLVLYSGARTAFAGSRELAAFTSLPLSLLPTFLVPLILASHIAIFARLSGQRSTEG